MTGYFTRMTAVLLFTGLICSGARADGGAVQLDTECGGYRIVAFTQPTPLRAGAVDLSVLVQNAATERTLRDVQVTIEVSRQGAGDFHLRQPAGSAGATNKLLQAARLTLPEAGTYDARILLDGPLGNVSAEFTLDVLEAMPRWFVQWPWLFWPIVPLGLYVWQSVARSRKLGKRMSTSCRPSAARDDA